MVSGVSSLLSRDGKNKAESLNDRLVIARQKYLEYRDSVSQAEAYLARVTARFKKAEHDFGSVLSEFDAFYSEEVED